MIRPTTFLEIADRRARAEVLHDVVVTAKSKIKRGKHCRRMGLSWRQYTEYVRLALARGLIEETQTHRGDLEWRKQPELVYLATEKGLAWAKVFWEVSKTVYGPDVGLRRGA